MATRWSRRDIRRPQRLTSPGYDVVRPRHRSTWPMDATAWSVMYLARQDVRSQPWFRHLDFVKVPKEDIKKIFWAPNKYNRRGAAAALHLLPHGRNGVVREVPGPPGRALPTLVLLPQFHEDISTRSTASIRRCTSTHNNQMAARAGMW